MFGCLMVFLGGLPETDLVFKRTTFLLGGMYMLNETDHLDKIATYQKGTFLVGSVAFVASYLYMLARLIERVNNNDIYPISYYYYIVRSVVAVLVAMILRHVVDLIPGATASQAILIMAFAIGFVPDLFIVAMIRVWKGEHIHVAAADAPARWLNERIDPQKLQKKK